jgi:hypothetical protein
LIDRLRGMAGELTPPDQALAFWFGGRPEEAVRLERRADDLRGWEPYLVAKARDLAIRGNGGEALAVLEGIATAARDTAYWEAVQAAAAADGDERRQALAGAELERTATSRVSREGFVLANESWRGELLCTRPVAGLTLSLRAETGGAGLDVRLDGERIGRFVLRGEQRITFDVAVEPGRHVVSVHARSGGSVTPVALELLGR